MPIIIDGWNFIRDKNSDIKDDDRCEALESARKLIMHLWEFQASHNDPITVVFDSRHEFLDINYKNNRKLTIVPAKDADGYIKKYIDKIPERQRRNLRVVSSDNDVFYYAKSSYATPVKCGEFWEKLNMKKRQLLTKEVFIDKIDFKRGER